MRVIKSKEHLINDVEELKKYLNVVSLDPNTNWGNNELMLFTKLLQLAGQLNGIQRVIQKQYTYPKPIKLRKGLSLSINQNWKTMIKLLKACPEVKDLGPSTTITKVKSYYSNLAEDREVNTHKFIVPRGTLGFLMSINPVGAKVTYTIAIPEPVSMKVQKSNYIDVDENAFSFNVSDEEKSTLKKAALNFFMSKCRGENLYVVEKVDSLMKAW